MKVREFYNWLINVDDQQYNTANSRLNNCLRVCEYEGDLDDHYEKDRCRELLFRLTYTMNDSYNNNQPKHSIPIIGNIYNGTATLRNAVNKYIRFRNYERINENINNRGIEIENRHRQGVNNDDRTLLQNKEFSKAVAEIINRFPEDFTINDMRLLANIEYCQRNFNCNYPIIRDITNNIHDLIAYTHIFGHRRFYSDIIITHLGRQYIISNDWYHNNENSNRNLFRNWIINKSITLNNIIRIFDVSL